jgi:hypothetical protein
LAPYTPVGGGCQRFIEPVLSPLLYNSNLLVYVKGIFEGAKIIEFIDMSIITIPNLRSGMKLLRFTEYYYSLF